MRAFFKSALVFLAIGIATSASAATYTLDFSGDICVGGACNPGDPIQQAYGDVPGEVDVIYDGNLFDVDTTGFIVPPGDPAYFWDSGYATLLNVAYAFNSASTLGITFAAAPGKTVTINGFDLGGYLAEEQSQVQIIDGASATTLFDSGLIGVPFVSVTSFTNPGDWTSSLITIAMGPNGAFVGIDNISFTVSDAAGGGTVNPIPLPAAGWLLLGGLGALGGLARRRTA